MSPEFSGVVEGGGGLGVVAISDVCTFCTFQTCVKQEALRISEGVKIIQIWRRIKKAYRAQGVADPLSVGVTLWISVAIFLGIGPVLQQALSETLDAPAPSIYSAAFDEGMIVAPSLSEWLSFGFEPGLAVSALVATLVSLWSRTYRSSALLAALAAATAISIVDTIIFSIDGRLESIGQSIFYNALGVPFVWLFLSIIFMLLDSIRSLISDKTQTRIAFGVSSIGIASAISTVMFLIFHIFYNPASVQFSVIAAPPTAGIFVADQTNLEADGVEFGKLTQPLSILPINSLIRKIDVNSVGAPLIVNWRQLDIETVFHIRVWPYYDCPYPQKLTSLPVSRPLIDIRAKTLTVQMSHGMSQFLGETADTRAVNLKVPHLAQYWLKGDEAGLMSVEAFVVGDDKITVNPSAGYKFYVGGPLSKTAKGTSRSAQRTVRFEIDGQPFSITAGGTRQLNSKRLECSPINYPTLEKAKDGINIIAPNAQSFFAAGALFEIIEKPVPSSVFRTEQSILVIDKANGWVEFSNFDTKQMTEKSLGRGRGISLTKNVTQFTVDGVPVKITLADDLFLTGDIRASFDGKKLEVYGLAKAAWLNSRRVNPTVWERMDGWQLPFVSALLGALGLFARWLWPKLSNFMVGGASGSVIQNRKKRAAAT